jgi:cytochrome oxidase assembly protein ShyY1
VTSTRVSESTTPFWRRPIWILGHLVALSAVVLFVRLGVWQLDRLEEKKDRNRDIAARSDGPPLDVLDVDLDAAKYQRVSATGTFDLEHETLIPYRSYQGSVGSHVVTPLVLEDSSVLLVNRGWVPDLTTPPPDGEVTVEGILLTSGDRRTSVDVEGIAPDAFPLWLLQTAPEPDGDYPALLPPPARDEGPHRSYAVQWFLFAGVVVVGYPILMRRRSRDAARVRVPDA